MIDKEFQKQCKGCYYADKAKVGTGEPCCTYCFVLRVEDGRCLRRKKELGKPLKKQYKKVKRHQALM